MTQATETFGQRLRRIREAAGLSRERLAVALGHSSTAIWCWECDKTSPRIEDIYKLAGVLKVSAMELVSATEA